LTSKTAIVGRVVAVLIAFFLLTAAGLKLHSLLYRPFAAGSPFLSRTAEFALLEVEIVLALWLLSGWRRNWAWLTTGVIFLLFALASLYMAWHGRSSCGCFGEVQVSPWITVGIDALIVSLVFLIRPCSNTYSSEVGWRSAAVVLGITLALLGGVLVLLAFSGVTPTQALVRLRGDMVTVEPTTIDGGSAPRGTVKSVAVHLCNHTDKPIRVMGGTTDCSCITTDDLPLTLPAGRHPVGMLSSTSGLNLQVRQGTSNVPIGSILMRNSNRWW
jgi:hypothetical protein